MSTQTTERLVYVPAQLDATADVRVELTRQGGSDDLIPAVYFILAEPVETRLEDTRDWIMIAGLLEGTGLIVLAYLRNAPLIYALAAVAFLVVAVGYVAWCGVWG